MKISPPTLLAALAFLGACATQPPPRYVRADPLPEPARPARVVKVATPMPLPGQLRRRPSANGEGQGAEAREPWTVVDAANRRAAQNPDDSGYFNAVMTYDFAPGALFQ